VSEANEDPLVGRRHRLYLDRCVAVHRVTPKVDRTWKFLWASLPPHSVYPSAMRSVVGLLAAASVAIACAACGPAHGASGTSVVRSVAVGPVTSQPDVPETLAAATAAAQANLDLFTAGDFAGVWEQMEQKVRNGITQSDFVTFYQACKTPGPKVAVTGMTLQSNDAAVVLVKVHGVERSRIMVYEDGRWNMQATAAFAERLGEPVQQIIAQEKADGVCNR
jgi:hypothetical protein